MLSKIKGKNKFYDYQCLNYICSMVKKDFDERFLKNRDESGRMIVVSLRTGTKFYVEPIGDGRGGDWCSENPATKEIEHKKGDGKFTGSVMEKESIITVANGFLPEQIHYTGNSYRDIIDDLDAKWPTLKSTK